MTTIAAHRVYWLAKEASQYHKNLFLPAECRFQPGQQIHLQQPNLIAFQIRWMIENLRFCTSLPVLKASPHDEKCHFPRKNPPPLPFVGGMTVAGWLYFFRAVILALDKRKRLLYNLDAKFPRLKHPQPCRRRANVAAFLLPFKNTIDCVVRQ